MENNKRKKQIHSALRYALLILLCVLFCLIEQTWFSLGIGISPFFSAMLCAAIGYYTSATVGMGFGIALGLFADAMGGSSIYILPVLYLLYGALAGILGEHMYRTRPLSAIVPLGAVSALHALYRALALLIGCGFQPRGLGGTFVSLGAALCQTLLLGLPLYLFVRLITRERKERRVRGTAHRKSQRK